MNPIKEITPQELEDQKNNIVDLLFTFDPVKVNEAIRLSKKIDWDPIKNNEDCRIFLWAIHCYGKSLSGSGPGFQLKYIPHDRVFEDGEIPPIGLESFKNPFFSIDEEDSFFYISETYAIPVAIKVLALFSKRNIYIHCVAVHIVTCTPLYKGLEVSSVFLKKMAALLRHISLLKINTLWVRDWYIYEQLEFEFPYIECMWIEDGYADNITSKKIKCLIIEGGLKHEFSLDPKKLPNLEQIFMERNNAKTYNESLLGFKKLKTFSYSIKIPSRFHYSVQRILPKGWDYKNKDIERLDGLSVLGQLQKRGVKVNLNSFPA